MSPVTSLRNSSILSACLSGTEAFRQPPETHGLARLTTCGTPLAARISRVPDAHMNMPGGGPNPQAITRMTRDVPISTQVRLIPPTLGAGLKRSHPASLRSEKNLLITAIKLNPNKENAT